MATVNVLGSAGVVFIRHLKSNLDIGGGFAVNSTFGYPMAFPAIYLNWTFEGRFKVNVTLGDGLDVSAGYVCNEYLNLSLACELNGQMALLEKDGKDVIFTHQYIQTDFNFSIQTKLQCGLNPFVDSFRLLAEAIANLSSNVPLISSLG